MVASIPDPQGIVAQHDGVAVDRNLGQIVEPGKLLFQLASLFVVISGHGKDLLTADPATVCDNACGVSHTEVAQKVEDVIRFHRGVKAIENCLIHLSDSREGPAAKADDVGMPKMEIGGEPSAWHTPRLSRDVQFLTQSAVDTLKNRLGHTDCPISALTPGFRVAPDNHPRFILEYSSDSPLAKPPKF